ncbi:chromatin accessibility complex protein 1 [Planococcus citri]|uniref:chromatin accessibility complex protein 1 n=1 Tax=Planococcus citri TaxID=170843 RepID=UPI0031F9639E
MESKKANGSSAKKESLLPISRIRIIMKSSPDTENIGQDSLFLVARSTELFVKYLTHKAYEMHKREKQKVLDYPSLADAVQTMESMAFLKEIMPRKITVKEYKEKLQNLDSDSNGEESS